MGTPPPDPWDMPWPARLQSWFGEAIRQTWVRTPIGRKRAEARWRASSALARRHMAGRPTPSYTTQVVDGETVMIADPQPFDPTAPRTYFIPDPPGYESMSRRARRRWQRDAIRAAIREDPHGW